MISKPGLICLLLIITLSGTPCKSGSENKIAVSQGKTVSGKVIKIIDGDTYDALIQGNKTIRVRMEGIDAPEKGMPFYRVSKNHLAKLCFNTYVSIQISRLESRGRVIAWTFLSDGTELSHEMIKSGLAWHFKKYNSDNDLAKLESEARKLKKGLWKDKNPMAPWINRSLHRKGISTKDSFDIKPENR
ncbi:MAG: thermonuclease family protein [Bacteroidales bacterium]|nr:thermonuclease family protein [Bacteroidales bacterium]